MFDNMYEMILALEGLGDLDALETDGETLFVSKDSDGEMIEFVSFAGLSEDDEIRATRLA